jgi:hypothetical protein
LSQTDIEKQIAGAVGPVTMPGSGNQVIAAPLPGTDQLQALEVNEQGVPIAGLGGGGILGTIGSILGAGATVYGVLEALGLGEGEGLFGLDILGGGSSAMPDNEMITYAGGSYVDSIPLSGPGLAEPPAAWIEKEWTTNQGGTKCQFYLVRMPTGRKRIAMYNFRTNGWKSWAVHKSTAAYIGKKLPSHKMLTRLRRNLKKHSSDARTILKITSPSSLATSRRRYTRRRR